MANYTIDDIIEQEGNVHHLYGYCGKIARIDLSSGEVSLLSTYDYVPKYIGGRMVINKIFWDEVGPGIGAFDKENKFIYMSGPTTGTGIPAGGRSAACAVGAANYPEQYTWGNIGGWFATELKYAGYDGFIIEGKADNPVFIKIEDEKIEIVPADQLWGMRVHQTQKALEEMYGHDFKSLVIGPAGENLVRIATITTGNDCVFGKGGFGAVWGSKNLKAITVCGHGVIAPADIEKMKSLRLTMNHPSMSPSPILHMDKIGVPNGEFPVEYDRANVACSPGCNQHCNAVLLDGKSAFEEGTVNHVEKCVSICSFDLRTDIPTTVGMFWPTEQNHVAFCKLLSREFPEPDFSDPDFEGQATPLIPDILNFWDSDYDRGTIVNDLCNEYGIDKWEIVIWLMTWLSMCKKEGLFSDTDLGCNHPIDVESEDFLKEFITNMVYRNGEIGNLFAEGMARAIRSLGYEKYSESNYHGRFSQVLNGKRLDLPVSLEAAWGQSVHWQGRGYEGAIEKPTWLAMNMMNMTSTRDAQTVEHFHARYEYHEEALADPYHSPHLLDCIIYIQNAGEIKDSIMSCEWQSPDLFWPTMEAEMFEAATGYPTSENDLINAAFRSKLLFRAILIRNHGRTRRMEMEAIWRILRVPDSNNEVADWQLWNEMVDSYYDARGWDLETGWPYRETYEQYGLHEVANEMEKLGLLPSRPIKRWSDYGDAPFVKFEENREYE